MSDSYTMPSSFAPPNVLLQTLSGAQTASVQNQLLQNQAATQDLADRATLRAQAPGLATNDPNAVANAAVLPGIGGVNTVNAMTTRGQLALQQQELAFKMAQIRGAQSAMDAIYPGPGAGSGSSPAATDGGPLPGQGGPSGTFEHQMGSAESGNNPTAQNKAGYIGEAQFGASRLADLGMYQPAPGEDVKANQWKGTFEIPGFPQVKTKADFLASPAAQHAAFLGHVANIDTAIAQTPGADQLDPNGLRAVAHLGGNDGMRKFVASGGAFNPADSNGTSLSKYYQKFAAGGVPALKQAFAPSTFPAGPPVATPGGVAARTGGTDVAGPGAGPAPDLDGPRPLPAIGPNSPVVTPASLANTPTPAVPPVATPPPQQPPAAQPAAQPPGTTPAPPQNNLTPAAQQPAAQPPGSAPPNTQPTGFATPRNDAAQPQAPVTNPATGLTAADDRALLGMKQGLQATMNPQGAQLLQAEIDRRVTANRALTAAAYTAAHPPIRSTTSQGVDAQGNPATVFVQGDRVVGTIPDQREPPTADYDIATALHTRDANQIAAIGDSGRAAQMDNIRVQEMRTILQNNDTGPGTDTKAALTAWLQRWAPASLTNWTRDSANLSGPAAIEVFQKEGFMGAVSQEKTSSPRGGYQATKMFNQFNPGAHLLTASNQGLLDQRLIANVADQDYAQGAQDHFTTQEDRYQAPGHSYTSLAHFDQQWQQQRNPQVYAAAMGAIGGQQPEVWADGLSEPEYKRALDIVSRADPHAVVNGKSGRISMQPDNQQSATPQAAPPVVKTQEDYNKLPPGPYVAPDGHTRLKS